VIPNWNGRDLLLALLGSIRAQTLQPAEILVVDNGSQDGSVELAREAGARVLEFKANRGFSFAVNRGIEAVRGDLIAILNNDVELEADWTERLAASLEQSGGWFAIGKLLDYAKRDRIDGAGDAICRGGTACRLGHARPDSAFFYTPRVTFFPSATAVLMRRGFLERAGNFDESFFAYLEDVDLGLRAALLGMGGIYTPGAVAYHRGSATWGAWSSQMVKCLTRNQILLLAKFYPWALIWQFRVPIFAAQVLWAAMAARRGRLVACLRGAASGLGSSLTVRRSALRWRKDGNRLAEILLRSEGELVRVQSATGWDDYWRWYFRLARHPEEPSL